MAEQRALLSRTKGKIIKGSNTNQSGFTKNKGDPTKIFAIH
jgi:hypothetical protein